jgi:hypothetical protein
MLSLFVYVVLTLCVCTHLGGLVSIVSAVRNEAEESICQPFLTSYLTSPLKAYVRRNLTVDEVTSWCSQWQLLTLLGFALSNRSLVQSHMVGVANSSMADCFVVVHCMSSLVLSLVTRGHVYAIEI